MEYKTHEGHLDASGLKFAIVVARFNSFITERLLSGALDALRRSGGQPDDVEVVRVPGSWEMPVVARALVETKRFDGIICLGCVVRGETAHADRLLLAPHKRAHARFGATERRPLAAFQRSNSRHRSQILSVT